MVQKLRVFISSPGDVRAAREIAAQIIERLAQDYARFFDLQPYLWESEAVIASGHFQDSLDLPSSFDIVVVILWSRLGTALPERTSVREYRGIDGRAPVTGTEWEFEEALQGWRRSGFPDLLVYRCMRPASFELGDATRRAQQLQQLSALDQFWGRHFTLEGELGYRMFTTDAEFAAALESNLRKRVARRLSAIQSTDGDHSNPAWVQAPFRGLESYEFEHAPIYFGQDEPLAKAMLQLTSNAEGGSPFLLVLGASGSGKSSLVRAGIVPKLFVQRRVSGTAFLRRVIFWPSDIREGEDMFDAFARRLATQIGNAEGLPEVLGPRQKASSLAAHFRHAAAAPGYPLGTALGQLGAEARQAGMMMDYETAKLVLVVDQLEELFTNEKLAPNDRRLFIELLCGLVKSGFVWVIATMRKDFWHRADETPELVKLAEGHGRIEMLPPTPSQLSQMIRRPAEAAGVQFEQNLVNGVPLNELIAEEVAHEPGALPLLSYLMDQLYRKDILDTGGNSLRYATYENLGRLEGAIATKADAVLAECQPEVRQALGSILFSLVQLGMADGAVDRAVARRVSMAAFPVGTPQRQLVDALLAPDARLLVIDADPGGNPTVRVAHEALISRWSLARDYVQSNATTLKIRRRIEERYTLWQALQSTNDAPPAHEGQLSAPNPVAALRSRWRSRLKHERGLLADIDAADGNRLLQEHRTELEPHLIKYIDRSVAYEERRRTRAVRVLAAVTVVVTVLAMVAGGAGWVAVQKRRDAEYQSARTMEAQSRLLTEVAAGRLKDGRIPSAQSIILEVLRGEQPHPSIASLDVFQQIRAADPQVAVLAGHTDMVETAVYSPDGNHILSASRDKSARIWDARTGAQLGVLTGHTGMVMTADYSPDGTRIVTASADNTARIWDTATWKPILVLSGHSNWVRSAAFSPDGTRIVTASYDKTARIWDARTGQSVSILAAHTDIVEWAAFSPDSHRVVTASLDGTARVWDVATGAPMLLLSGHRERVASAAYSPDGNRIVTASFDQTVRVWDAHTGAPLMVLNGHTDRVEYAAYSPDGKQIVTAAGDMTARVWDAATGAQLEAFFGHSAIVLMAAYSPDGTRIVTASYDGLIRVWDAAAAKPRLTLSGHTGSLSQAAYSPDGQRIVTASRDKTARIWDSKSGAPIMTLAGHGDIVNTALFSPDGTRIFTASFDKTARMWDAANGSVVAVIAGHDDVLEDAHYSTDGGRVVTTSLDKTARIWNAHTGESMGVLRGHTSTVRSAVFSPDGTRILTTAGEHTARIWDASTYGLLRILNGHHDTVNYASYSPDGATIITASDDKTLGFWDAKSGELIRQFTGYNSPIDLATYSPDARRILSVSDDGVARILDSLDGAPLAIFSAHSGSANSAAYSPDGNHIVTATQDKTALIWDASIPAENKLQILWYKSAEFEPLTEEERSQLGRTPDPYVRQWPKAASECDQAAGAFYDPDRVAPGVLSSALSADAGLSACNREMETLKASGRLQYQLGRALLAKHDYQNANEKLEFSAAAGYRVADVDLAKILLDGSIGAANTSRAVSLYEEAWQRGVPIAAFALGQLYEHGAYSARAAVTELLRPDEPKAWLWYQRGVTAREPNSLARLAERYEQEAFEKSGAARNELLVHAVEFYAMAAESARRESWPDNAWCTWRYRRATLSRLLAREGLMAEVATAYENATVRH